MVLKVGHIKSLSLIDHKNLIDLISKMIEKKSYAHIVQLDLTLFIKTLHNKKLRSIINKADLVIPKGKFFVWGLKKLFPHLVLKEKIAAQSHDDSEQSDEDKLDDHHRDYVDWSEKFDYSNLSLSLLRHFETRGVRFFFIGDTLENVNLAFKHLKQGFPGIQILGSHPKSQLKRQQKEILEKLRKVSPNILFVDIKKGKQEQWIFDHKESIEKTICIGLDRDIRMFAGKIKGIDELFDRFIKGQWMFAFRAFYFLFLIFLYKTFLKKEIQCVG